MEANNRLKYRRKKRDSKLQRRRKMRNSLQTVSELIFRGIGDVLIEGWPVRVAAVLEDLVLDRRHDVELLWFLGASLTSYPTRARACNCRNVTDWVGERLQAFIVYLMPGPAAIMSQLSYVAKLTLRQLPRLSWERSSLRSKPRRNSDGRTSVSMPPKNTVETR